MQKGGWQRTNHLVDKFPLWHRREAELRTDNYWLPGWSEPQTGVNAVGGYIDSSTGSDISRQSMGKKIMEVEVAKLILQLDVRCWGV